MDIKLFLNKLIENTKSNALNWYYLDTYSLLSQNAQFYLSYAYSKKNSFYVKINDGYFVLADSNTYLYLIVFPTIDSREVTVINYYNNTINCQDELLRLLNLIKKQYPQVDDVISDFLNGHF